MILAEKSSRQNHFVKLAWAVVTACALTGMSSATAASGPLVIAEDGIFHGVATPTMNEFLGIRYAQAPVGELRWKPPRRPGRAFGFQDASQFQSHCPQNASPFGLASTTEDCLFLNVFTPVGKGRFGRDADHDHDGRLPVMFWIHGGALVVGESDDYNPQRLVEQGVVVVTINYRLGALGFL